MKPSEIKAGEVYRAKKGTPIKIVAIQSKRGKTLVWWCYGHKSGEGKTAYQSTRRQIASWAREEVLS